MVRPRKHTDPTRAAVRHNALTHGLRSADVIIQGELRQHWRHFHDLVISELAPATPIQRELAGHIATLLWRLRRVPRAESWLTRDESRLDDVERMFKNLVLDVRTRRAVPPAPGDDDAETAPLPGDADTPDRPFAHLMVPVEHSLDRLLRYENHLYRQLYRAMDRLVRMQTLRQHAADETPA